VNGNSALADNSGRGGGYDMAANRRVWRQRKLATSIARHGIIVCARSNIKRARAWPLWQRRRGWISISRQLGVAATDQPPMNGRKRRRSITAT